MANPFKTCIIAEAQVSPALFALFVHYIDHFAQAREVPLLRGEDEAGRSAISGSPRSSWKPGQVRKTKSIPLRNKRHEPQ